MSEADRPTISELVVVICADQRERWTRSEPALVEQYLEEYTALAGNRELTLDLIYNEICIRHELGETPDCADYRRRFPQFEAELKALLEIHLAIESDGLRNTLHDVDAVPPAAETAGNEGPGRADGADAVELTQRPQNDEIRLPALSGTGEEGPEQPLTQFADYEILSVVARGGMGVVYRARQRSLDRIVALKTIRSGELASEDEVVRFRNEAAAAAHLQHHNIVAIHEVGEERGQHFFSMDFIEGPTLAELVRDHPLAPERAARYLRQIAQAVQYAHQQNTLHRDLKPSNVLIDASDQPQITDFGLAKRVDGGGHPVDTTMIVGTASYMPPEQIDKAFGQTGPAGDVYSLGAILYELLTGRPPFRAANVLDTLQQVVRLEPVRPRLLNPSIRRDLETICLKCLEKDPRRRYGSARELADDLRQYLNGDPIAARPVSKVERAWRKCRKRPVVSLLGLLAVALTVLVAVAGPIVAIRERALRATADESRRQAEQERQRVERQLRITTAHRITSQARAALDDFPQRSLLLAIEALNVTLQVGEPPVPAAEQFLRNALARVGGLPLAGFRRKTNHVRFSPDARWLAVTTDADNHARLWDFRDDPTSTRPLILRGHREAISSLAFTPDGSRLITASWDHTVRLWDLTADDPSAGATVLQDHQDAVYEIAVSPDGRWLATAGSEKTVRLWSLTADDRAAACTILRGHSERITGLAISPNSKWLATTSVDGTARLWSLSAETPRAGPIVLRGHEQAPFRAVFSPDGRWLATTGSYGPDSSAVRATVRLWDTAGGDPVDQAFDMAHGRDPSSVVSFSPDNRWLLVAPAEGPPHLWDCTAESFPRGEPIVLPHDGEAVIDAKFSPDGRWLATVGLFPEKTDDANQVVHLWYLGGRELQLKPRVLSGHGLAVWQVEFSPGGKWLATSGADGAVALWELYVEDAIPTAIRLRGHEGSIDSLAMSPDGNWMVTGGADLTLRLWNMRTPGSHAVVQTVRDRTNSVVDIAISPRESMLATSGTGSTVHLWNVAAGRLEKPVAELREHQAAVSALGYGRNGDQLITVSRDRTARIWEMGSDKRWGTIRILRGHQGAINSAAISPNGCLLLTGSGDTTARLWYLTTDADSLLLHGHQRSVVATAIGPNNCLLATSGLDGLILLWMLEDATTVSGPLVLEAHDGPVFFVAFDSDGRWLISGSTDGTARLWNLKAKDPTGACVVLYEQTRDMDAIRISPDHRQLVTTDYGGRARIWNLAAADPRKDPLVLHGPPGSFHALAISMDSRVFASGATDGTVRLWDLEAPFSAPIALRGPRTRVSSLAFTLDSHWLIAGDEKGLLRMWNLHLKELIHYARRVAGRPLTARERREYLPSETSL